MLLITETEIKMFTFFGTSLECIQNLSIHHVIMSTALNVVVKRLSLDQKEVIAFAFYCTAYVTIINFRSPKILDKLELLLSGVDNSYSPEDFNA